MPDSDDGAEVAEGLLQRFWRHATAGKETYCHPCSDDYYSFRDECPDCETELDVPPVTFRAVETVKFTITVAILSTLVFGPPLFVVFKILSGAPLWGTETVVIETTRHYGVIPEGAPVLIVWLIILMTGWGMATGAFPRP